MDPKEVVRRGYDELSVLYRADDAEPAEYQQWIDQLISKIPPGGRVLDLGCGCGVPVSRSLAIAGFEVVGVDFSEVQLARAGTLVPKAEFVLGDITAIDFEAESFDAIVCLFAIIHVPLDEQPALVRNMARWLRPGGLLLLSTGNWAWTGSSSDWLGGVELWWSHADRDTYGRWLFQARLHVEKEHFVPEGDSGHALFWARRDEAPGEVPWCRDSGTRGLDFIRSLGTEPAVEEEPEWAAGTLRTSLYLTDQRPPDDLATSMRCVVIDGDQVVLCQNANGAHVVPGGRREVGETWEETARREVWEETGFRLGELEQVAVILLHREGERPDDPSYTYPHPDTFWVVFRATPVGREADTWTDTEGWELSSELVPIDDALARDDLWVLDQALLRAIR